MAAVIPMRYGSCASAGAGTALATVMTPSAAMRMRRRMSALLFQGSDLGADAPFFIRSEHRLHQVVITLEHEPPLHLARGRHRLPFLLGIELAWQYAERF